MMVKWELVPVNCRVYVKDYGLVTKNSPSLGTTKQGRVCFVEQFSSVYVELRS